MTLQALPEGTAIVTIGRIRPDSHQRGGRRDHVVRVAPTEFRATLAGLKPGRYRVASLNPRGHFVRGGSFALEVLVDSLEPVVVPPRTPSDYPRRPSKTAAARRGVQRIEHRVQTLREQLREANAANAQLARAAAAQREKHLKEAVASHEMLEALGERVERLASRLEELATQGDARDKKGRQSLAAMRAELANERRQRAAEVAGLRAGTLPLVESVDNQEQTLPEPVIGEQSFTAAHDAPPPLAEVPTVPMQERPLRVNDARTAGFAALAGIRNPPQQGPRPDIGPSAPSGPPPLTGLEALALFLRNLPRGSM